MVSEFFLKKTSLGVWALYVYFCYLRADVGGVSVVG